MALPIFVEGCLSLEAKDIKLDAVGRQFLPVPPGAFAYWWRPCGVTRDADPEKSWLLKLQIPAF